MRLPALSSKRTAAYISFMPEATVSPYEHCLLCPRACGVDRTRGETGFCGEGAVARVSVACLHKGEEPPLSGERGSGTVFFTGCTLGCPSCQNYVISGGTPASRPGRTVAPDELARIFFTLQERGAYNVNLVTGTQFIPSIITALRTARANGLAIPAVWNSNGYESTTALELLHPHIDIHLPDLKTLDPGTARELFGRRDYPARARPALLAMVRDRALTWHGDILSRGVIVRHLVLPGRTASTLQCLEWFRDHLAGRALLSIMFQYIPLNRGAATGGAKVNREEYTHVTDALAALGLDDGFVQEPVETDDWIPDFSRPNPFPSGFAEPVWRAGGGFI
jgi:putative pyruvate formate lyase activating enzyme